MTTPRSKLVDPQVSRWFHCISRCVRQAFLLSNGSNRKQWVEDRLRNMTNVFAVSVGGFAILDNHFHFLIRLDPAVAESWTPEEVVTRWAELHPPRHKRKPVPISAEWIAEQTQDVERVAVLRRRLSSLSWFMKEIKEPLARLANKEDKCKGAFFEGRFKSIALLDEQAVLTACAYIDLNPLSSGMASTPESSPFTSLSQRVAHALSHGRQHDLAKALEGSVPASMASGGLEDELWLIPIEDRRRYGSEVEGMFEGFTLGNYLMLVEYTGQTKGHGRNADSTPLEGVFERLGTSPGAWSEWQNKLSSGPLVGRFLSATHQGLSRVCKKLGLHHCLNVNACATV